MRAYILPAAILLIGLFMMAEAFLKRGIVIAAVVGVIMAVATIHAWKNRSR